MRPNCCHPDYDALFNDHMARRELEAYRRKGAGGPTRRLIDELMAEGVEGATLLDIGGGIGAIQHERLESGAARSLDIDASRAYLAAARDEADRRGFGDRVAYRYGDFVALADEVESADIVTLDRVICCYADMPPLVSRSADRARRRFGLVYPVDRWWTRLGARLVNAGLALFRQSFRFHVHATDAVEALLAARGFVRQRFHDGLVWQTALYRRASTTPSTAGACGSHQRRRSHRRLLGGSSCRRGWPSTQRGQRLRLQPRRLWRLGTCRRHRAAAVRDPSRAVSWHALHRARPRRGADRSHQHRLSRGRQRVIATSLPRVIRVPSA